MDHMGHPMNRLKTVNASLPYGKPSELLKMMASRTRTRIRLQGILTLRDMKVSAFDYDNRVIFLDEYPKG
jgi:hypothetical protein